VEAEGRTQDTWGDPARDLARQEELWAQRRLDVEMEFEFTDGGGI
jgi:hypothetical protein